jgi:NADPH:quinone reductase-like Zn-dependent oxidoreductase
MKTKAASRHWECMFARAIFATADMLEQHQLLNCGANAIDTGRIRTTLSEALNPSNTDNIRTARALIETAQAMGKIVVQSL